MRPAATLPPEQRWQLIAAYHHVGSDPHTPYMAVLDGPRVNKLLGTKQYAEEDLYLVTQNAITRLEVV